MDKKPKYSISTYSGSEKKTPQAIADIEAYYAVRKDAYVKMWGESQNKYYGNPPTAEDSRDNTVFLIIKANDPASGKQVVIGGRRIVFPEEQKIGTLPLETKHGIQARDKIEKLAAGLMTRDKADAPIRPRKGHKTGGYQALLTPGKTLVDMQDIVPALRQDSNIRYAEIGAFAIDPEVSRQLLGAEERKQMLQQVYQESLKVAKHHKADIAVIDAGGKNKAHQKEWLQSSTYKYKYIADSKGLFSNPISGGPATEEDKTQLLLVDVSGRYELSGPNGILRFSKGEAAGR